MLGCNLSIRSGVFGPPGDPAFANVLLLIHPTGADGATAFVDKSSYARTVTLMNQQVTKELTVDAVNFPAITGAIASAKWAGRGTSHLEIGVAADWQVLHDGSTPWSYDGWHQFDDFSAAAVLFTTNAGSSNQPGVYCNINSSRQIEFFIFNANVSSPVVSESSTGFWPNDTGWHFLHIDWDRSLASGNLLIYVDNVLIHTGNKTANSPAIVAPNHTLLIGTAALGGGSSPKGRFAEARFTKTSARGHAVPTAVWPDA